MQGGNYGDTTINTVLFDLGNTLVRYYELPQFPQILERAIAEAKTNLLSHGVGVSMGDDEIQTRVRQQDYEAPDYQVRPLSERLRVIFGLTDVAWHPAADTACRAFMMP